MDDIQVTIAADDAVARRNLRSLIAGSAGLRLLSTFEHVRDAADRLDVEPCDVLVIQLSTPERELACVRAIAGQFPTLRMLALVSAPDDAAMLELVRAGVRGCLPADQTPAARVVEAIVELYRGGSPLSGHLAAALVAEVQAKSAALPHTLHATRREIDLLRLLAKGHSYKTAAAELGLSVDTVRFHLRNLYAKLHVHSKVEAVLKATRDGLI